MTLHKTQRYLRSYRRNGLRHKTARNEERVRRARENAIRREEDREAARERADMRNDGLTSDDIREIYKLREELPIKAKAYNDNPNTGFAKFDFLTSIYEVPYMYVQYLPLDIQKRYKAIFAALNKKQAAKNSNSNSSNSNNNP